MKHRIGAVLEVTIVFLLVIGICRCLFQVRSIPFIARTLPLWAAALFLYTPLLLLFVQKRSPRDWGLTLHNVRSSVATAGIVSLLCLPAFVVLYLVYQRLWFGVSAPFSLSAGWFVLLLYHLACVALPEEVFYRGYMQSRLNDAFSAGVRVVSVPLGIAWLYTAVLFALGHYLIDFRVETLATFFPGLLFGWLRERTGNIVASTIFHALCNATILLVS